MEAIRNLWERVGGLSEPSKMPCDGYSIPATRCKVGSLLRKVEGSTCSKCYALKGRYVFPNVVRSMEKRYCAMQSPEWVSDMSALIGARIRNRKRKPGGKSFFRWHDSGDIQNLEHLSKIVDIANRLPKVRFWLPTREREIVRSFLAGGKSFPPNLTVRMSAPMIGSAARSLPGTVASSVNNRNAFQCEAYSRGGYCGPCRACWDSKIPDISYPKH